MEKTDKCILVLGSDLSTNLVTSSAWDKLPEDLNVADYDVVIVNLIPLHNEEYARQVDRNRLPSKDHFYLTLFSENSEIIFIGYPAEIPETKYNPKDPYYPRFYTHEWLPLIPEFVSQKGSKIIKKDNRFDFWFEKINFYHYYLESHEHFSETYPDKSESRNWLKKLIHPDIYKFKHQLDIIAETRFHKAIAFELIFTALNYGEQNVLKKSGNVIWLPPTTEIPQDEGICLILKHSYGLQLTQIQPSWLSAYKLPHQIPVEEKITQYQEEIKRLESQVQASQQQLQNETRFLQLLYEQHEALEIVIRDTLSLLDAEVEKAEKGKEDGRFTDTQGRKGMLEIKGKTGTLALKDINQLDRRVRDAKILEGKDDKGIVIINAHCDKPPNQRPDPFPANCIETAEQTAKQCLITTSQLFKALCDHQEGKLNIEEFWDTIFNTNGVCPLPDIEPQDIETCNNSVGMVGDAHPTMINFEN